MTYQTKAELRNDIEILQVELKDSEKCRDDLAKRTGKFAAHVVHALGIRDVYFDGWGLDLDRLYADFEALVAEKVVQDRADALRKAIKDAGKADS